MAYFGRKIIYLLSRARPPRYGRKFPGPVLVVGSAPVANLPEGFDDTFTVITVNGSQFNAGKWGIQVPHITFLTFGHVEGNGKNARNVRPILFGERTRVLYVLRWRHGVRKLKQRLATINYGYDELRLLSRYQRMALHERVMGFLNLETSPETRFSNGITAVLFALFNGAEDVIITGIDPGSSGHAYSAGNLQRQHGSPDMEVLTKLKARGARIFTADPGVADRLGLPLWKPAG